MKTVVWVTQVFPRNREDVLGGFLLRLARELPARGWGVTVVAPGSAGAPADEILEGVRVVRFPYGPREIAYLGEMHKAAQRHPVAFFRFLRAFKESVRRTVRDASPQLIHAHWWAPSGWIALTARQRPAVPLIVSLHGTDMRLLRKVPFAGSILRSVVGQAQLVLPVSVELDRQVALAKIPQARRRVLPMPADAEVFRLADNGQVPEREPRFLVVARLTAQKRVRDVIEALRILIADGVRARLDVVGDGPERRNLEQSIRGSLDDSVRFHGFVPPRELAPLYRNARALVLPAEGEGYGLVIVEAGLCGTPTIGADSGGIRDLVRPEETGLLVEVGSPKALSVAMRRFVEDPTAAGRMGRAAHAEAQARTSGPIADRLVSLYKEATGTPL